ncbi:MAG: transporter ATP-binding protein [Acidimicrobiales bacterium]|nr:transporter ATP-binding protein [Acidimicrobiales bacterium]
MADLTDSEPTPKPKRGFGAFWTAIRPYLGATNREIWALIITSAILGFFEAGVLVLMMRGAVAITSGEKTIDFAAGPVGVSNMSMGALFGIAIVMLVLIIAGRWWSSALIAKTSAETLSTTRKRLLRAFIHSGWPLQSGERSGQLQEQVTTNVVLVSQASLTLASGAAAAFQFLALMLSALVIQPVAAVLITFSVGLLYLAFRPLSRSARRLSRQAVDANKTYAGEVADAVTMTLEVNTFDVGDPLSDRIDLVVDHVAQVYRRQKFVAKLLPSLYQNAVLVVVLGGLLAIYAFDIKNVASLGAVVLILVRGLTYTQVLQTSHQVVNDMTPYLEAVRDEELRYLAAAPDRGGLALPSIEEIRFDNVSFSYGEDKPDALKELTLAVQRGEAVGVVGPSGSGKSTFMQLLLRQRQPSSGAVLINGVPASDYAAADWYHRVALVPQEARLLSGTVLENVRFFRPELTDADIRAALEMAHVADDVDRFPGGWDSHVGERGGGAVSGGQRQRLCIARALTTKPDVLVLDEPTSALDMHSEALIRDTLESLKGSVTLFIIAHRMSTLAACDRIMVLDQGRLVAFGPAEELMETNAFFNEASRLSKL